MHVSRKARYDEMNSVDEDLAPLRLCVQFKLYRQTLNSLYNGTKNESIHARKEK